MYGSSAARDRESGDRSIPFARPRTSILARPPARARVSRRPLVMPNHWRASLLSLSLSFTEPDFGRAGIRAFSYGCARARVLLTRGKKRSRGWKRGESSRFRPSLYRLPSSPLSLRPLPFSRILPPRSFVRAVPADVIIMRRDASAATGIADTARAENRPRRITAVIRSSSVSFPFSSFTPSPFFVDCLPARRASHTLA